MTASISKDTQVVSRGTGLLPWAFSKARVVALLSAVLDNVQAAEDEIAWLIDTLDLETADGAKLDLIGRRVKEARDGRADAVYRNFIKVRILRNRSVGEGWRVAKIARLMLGGTTVSRRRAAPRYFEATVKVAAHNDFATRAAAASAAFEAATTDAIVNIIERKETGYFGWDEDGDASGWDTGIWAELC